MGKEINMKVGCIGQGFVGKNLSDDFENRGIDVVRYALEEEYLANKDSIKNCEVVFIALPTPTTPNGFNFSLIEGAFELISPDAVVIIKSTVLPGTTKQIQDKNRKHIVLHSPELLSERTASYDSARPLVNVIGMAHDTTAHRKAAEKVKTILPNTDHNYIVPAEAAELYKYAHNLNGYFRIILTNLLHDMGEAHDVDWSDVKSMIDSDIMMSPYYNKPIHKGGRGAGGHCFVKDMAAFRHAYEKLVDDVEGLSVLKALENKNLKLLNDTGKSQDIIKEVYGQ